MKTPSLNHTKDDWLLLATTSTINPSRSQLMKVLALPILGFSKPSHKEFSSTQASLSFVFANVSLPLYL